MAGLEAAIKIAEAKGGARAYFPAVPGAEHWLSQLVGKDKAGAIGKALAPGQWHEVPMGPSASQAKRWRMIIEMSDEGHSKPAIARAAGVHHKTVQRIVNGKRRTVDRVLAQKDLFE